MTVSKKVCHVIPFRILFLFLFLSLTTGTGKGDTPKGILLCEGSGPLKGKCALGPFLSILVIECQHKCLNVIHAHG
jgi:hypothetical protein